MGHFPRTADNLSDHHDLQGQAASESVSGGRRRGAEHAVAVSGHSEARTPRDVPVTASVGTSQRLLPRGLVTALLVPVVWLIQSAMSSTRDVVSFCEWGQDGPPDSTDTRVSRPSVVTGAGALG